MKLHRAIISEMTGPIPYELTLGEIISAGDTTDNYQVYVLSLLSGFFASGQNFATLTADGLAPLSSDATSTRAIESIKSLSPSDKVKLATYLLDCIAAGYSALHNTYMSSSDWITLILRGNNV